MKHLLIVFFLGMTLLLPSCSSQQPLPVIHARDLGEQPVSEGFFYMLPRTVATVDVWVTRTESTPGPFAEYAGRYLGLEDVIQRSSVEHEITRVEINSYAEPDPAQVYFVPFVALQHEAFFVSLNESGLIQSVNVPFDHQQFMKTHSDTQQYGFFGQEVTFNHFMDTNLQEKIDTITERVRVDTLTVERQTLRRSWVEKSFDVRAREVADQIILIREKKFDIISGFQEIPYSKEALEYMTTELEALEQEYLKLFTGITAQSTINYRYTVLPEEASRETFRTLFRFSAREGVLDANRQEGYPVSLEIQSIQAAQALPGQGNAPNASGLYYRIPEHATVMLREGNVVRAETRMLINQFGTVSRMAPQGMQMEFYPNTGSVKSIGALRHPNNDQ